MDERLGIMATPNLDAQVETALHAWPDMTPLVFVPRTEAEFLHLLEVTKYIANIVRSDEKHPLLTSAKGSKTVVDWGHGSTSETGLAGSPPPTCLGTETAGLETTHDCAGVGSQ
jgi:hypothetical protein